MLTKYLRELLKPIIYQCMNENELTVSNRYIADMRSINRDLYDIRMSLIGQNGIEIDAKDIADNISAYDIASHIEVDVSEINLHDLADHITDNIEINASDIDIDYRDLGSRIASEIYSNDRLDTLERKMDLLLKHLGITPENA